MKWFIVTTDIKTIINHGKTPYTYNRKDSPYGEENALSPETASILHRNLKEMLTVLNEK